MVEALLRAGADVSLVDSHGSSPLLKAVMGVGSDGRRRRIVEHLLAASEAPSAAANCINARGQSPLASAVESELPDTIRALMVAGADPNAVDAADGSSVLASTLDMDVLEAVLTNTDQVITCLPPETAKRVAGLARAFGNDGVAELVEAAGAAYQAPPAHRKAEGRSKGNPSGLSVAVGSGAAAADTSNLPGVAAWTPTADAATVYTPTAAPGRDGEPVFASTSAGVVDSDGVRLDAPGSTLNSDYLNRTRSIHLTFAIPEVVFNDLFMYECISGSPSQPQSQPPTSPHAVTVTNVCHSRRGSVARGAAER